MMVRKWYDVWYENGTKMVRHMVLKLYDIWYENGTTYGTIVVCHMVRTWYVGGIMRCRPTWMLATAHIGRHIQIESTSLEQVLDILWTCYGLVMDT